MKRKIYLLILALLTVCGQLSAQVTSSSMAGIVKDDQKKELIGATVKLTHLPSGTVYGTVTQSDGSFNLNNLRVGGPYKVEISYLGFETKTYNDIYLVLGETFRLNTVLAEGAASGTNLKEVNIVAGRNPILNSQRTGTSTNISTEQLNTLPTIGRGLSDFTRLTPQGGPSFSSSVNNDNTFGGRDGRYNNIQINGANFNNSFGLNNNLLPGGGAQPISLDAIEEVQVGFAPYDVRQTGFTGANVNAITRSGTNEYTGSVYFFWRNQNFNGNHVGKDMDVPFAGNSTKQLYGIRVGGPIIKNKLFFFVNAEKEKSTAAGVTWQASRPGVSGSNVSAVQAATLDSLSDFLKTKYNYDPGSYENFANEAVTENTKLLARLDYNINSKHKAFFSFSSLNATEPVTIINSTSTGAGSRLSFAREGNNSLAFSSGFYGFSHKVWSLSGQISSNFSSRLSNELIATYSNVQDTRITNGSDFPFVDINVGNGTTSFGTELFSYKNDLINKNLNIIDNVTYNLGRHTIVGGIAYEYLQFGNSFLPSGTSYYRYNSVSDFINGKSPIAFAYTYPFEEQGDNTYVKTNYGVGSIYIQDKVNVTDRLNVTAGLRLEMPFYTYKLVGNDRIDTLHVLDKDGNPVTYQSGEWPKSKPVLSPRIGFNWDINGDRSIQLRGGTGIFAGKVPFVWFTNQAGNIGTLTNNRSFALSNKSHADSVFLNSLTFNPDPKDVTESNSGSFPTQGGTAIPSSIAIVSPDFKMPRIWRTNIGVDAKLPFGLVGSAEAIYTKDLVNVYMRNANMPAPKAKLNNGDDQRDYYTSTRYNSATSGYYVLENSNKGESFVFSIGVSKPARKGFYGSIFYTATYSKDLSSNPGSQASSAWAGLPNAGSPNDQVLSYSEYLTPHRLVGSISYRFEYAKMFATTVSLYYEGASLGRFSYQYASDINGDGVNADLIYVPNDANELQWADIKDKNGNVLFTQQQQIDAFNSYINQDKYLKDRKGQYAERYGAKYPFYNRFDLKLIQDVFRNVGGRKPTLQFTVDMFNIANFINPEWGVQKRLAVGSANTSSILTVSKAGNATTQPVYQMTTTTDNQGNTVLPTSTFVNNVSTLSTWSMQLGLRLTF